MTKKKTLYVVCSRGDTAFANQILHEIRKQEEGTESHFCIIALSEEQWQIQKDALAEGKMIFLGPVQRTPSLPQAMPLRFQKYGVSYGWSDGQGFLLTDATALNDKRVYQDFLEELKKECQVEEILRGAEKTDALQLLGLLCVALFIPFGSVLAGGRLVERYLHRKIGIKKQQYFYGLLHFYKNDMKDFMEIGD